MIETSYLKEGLLQSLTGLLRLDGPPNVPTPMAPTVHCWRGLR